MDRPSAITLSTRFIPSALVFVFCTYAFMQFYRMEWFDAGLMMLCGLIGLGLFIACIVFFCEWMKHRGLERRAIEGAQVQNGADASVQLVTKLTQKERALNRRLLISELTLYIIFDLFSGTTAKLRGTSSGSEPLWLTIAASSICCAALMLCVFSFSRRRAALPPEAEADEHASPAPLPSAVMLSTCVAPSLLCFTICLWTDMALLGVSYEIGWLSEILFRGMFTALVFFIVFLAIWLKRRKRERTSGQESISPTLTYSEKALNRRLLIRELILFIFIPAATWIPADLFPQVSSFALMWMCLAEMAFCGVMLFLMLFSFHRRFAALRE